MAADNSHEPHQAPPIKSAERPSVRAAQRDRREVLTAVVRKIRASSAVVELPGGRKATLPAREIYADFKAHEDLQKRGIHLHGTRLDVVEFDAAFGKGERLVSHVRVANDPWDVVRSWADGAVKVMEVNATTRVRAIGLIHPGIRAEVRLEPLRELLEPSWGEFTRPLVGDELAGFFHLDEVDHNERVVFLDAAGYVSSKPTVGDVLAPRASATEAYVDASQADPGTKHAAELPLFGAITFQEIDRVLFVDDDDIFRSSVTGFLEARGCCVTACGSEQEAINAIEHREQDFDLAIIDIHLSQTRGYEGLVVLRGLRMELPHCPVVITSGQDLSPADSTLAAFDVHVNHFVTKPFGHEELHRALSALGNDPRALVELLPGAAPPRIGDDRRSRSAHEQHRLNTVVDAFRARVRAESAVLFSIHPTAYTVEFVARADPKRLFPFVKPRLDRSPVRDVAVMGEEIVEADAKVGYRFRKHLYLQTAYDYRSCLAVPVSLDMGSMFAYALFAFHREVQIFHKKHLAIAHAYARELGHVLRIAQLEEELQEAKPFELMGKVYGSMAHDLTGVLSLEFLAGNLMQLWRDGKSENHADSVDDMLQQLLQRSKEAKNIVTTFRNMARGVHEETTEFRVDEALAAIVSHFVAEGSRRSINVQLLPHKGPQCFIRMRSSGFAQILYNLLLNAAQQIERLGDLRGDRGEIIAQLTVVEETDSQPPYVVIRIHDNGPGIHGRDFDRVFQVHYTTKPHGCGMGLTICRRIASDVTFGGRRGSLRVARSILLTGTTFELQLPVVRTQ